MDTFHLIPIGSMYAFPPDQSAGFIDSIGNLPTSIKELISSENTAAYITGIAKSHKIPSEMQPSIAFVILRLAIGKVPMSDFTITLSTELQISVDEAQKMATEIYRDLFAPIQDDLDAFLARGSAPATPSVDSSIPKSSAQPLRPASRQATPAPRTPNVLNLKELGGRTELPELPARPAAPRVAPTASRTVDLKNPPVTPPAAPKPPTPPTPPTPPAKTFPLPPITR